MERGQWGFTLWSFPKMEIKVVYLFVCLFYTNQKDTWVLNSTILIWVIRESFLQGNLSAIYLALHLSNVLSMHEAGASHCQSASLHFLSAVQGSQQEFSKIWLLSIQPALVWGRLGGFQCGCSSCYLTQHLKVGWEGKGLESKDQEVGYQAGIWWESRRGCRQAEFLFYRI